MFIIFILICLMSGVLFRVRGGALNYMKWWIDSATFARLVYAIPVAGAIVAFVGAPWWVAPILAAWLWFACTRALWASYGPQPDANKGSSFLKMTGCGMFFLSPFYAIIYHMCYKYRSKLNFGPRMLIGWTAWAEFIFGITIPVSMIGAVVLGLRLV